MAIGSKRSAGTGMNLMYLLDTDYMSLMQRGTVEGQALFQCLMSRNIALNIEFNS
jgi:hypothetical protein